MIRVRWLAAALLLTLALAAAGCSGGSSGKKTPTATAAPQIKDVVHSGNASIDHTLDAALAPDSIELARLTGYQKVACAAQEDAEHPACIGSEKPGDVVEAFPKSGCQHGWVRPADLPPVYAAALDGKQPQLAGIYEPKAGVDAYGADSIGVILTGKHDDGTGAGVAVHIKAGRIVTLEDDCGAALKLLDQQRVAKWIIQPGQTGASGTTPAAKP